jgi:hypothetical protein
MWLSMRDHILEVTRLDIRLGEFWERGGLDNANMMVRLSEL